MKTVVHKFGSVLFSLGVALLALSASAAPSDFELIGSGSVTTNCAMTLTSGCTINTQGSVSGAALASGAFVVRIDTGSPALFNGYPAGPGQGVCLPGSFIGSVTTTAGDELDFSHVGMVCEEAAAGAPYHYNGTFRITGGAGIFTGAAGGGSLSVTITRDSLGQPGQVYLYLHGVIDNGV
jgi:hypothetical protein